MSFTSLLTAAAAVFFAAAGSVHAGPILTLKAPAVNGPVVQVRNGSLKGVYSTTYDQDFFLGVPFAQAPVGQLRFSNPASITTGWSGVRDASAYAPYCQGYGPDSTGKDMSEDCLYLNVVRPAGYENQSLPVAFWIHSSSFTMGGTSDPRFNLTWIVQRSVEMGKPIIAVSAAYRLNMWGFIASKEVSASGNTNLGLKDQRLAMHWVQENIAAFGGDPTKVTIWGQSAGATSVGYHLTAYNGRDDGLFRGAIMQSGNPINHISFRTPADYQTMYNAVVLAVGCGFAWDTLGCLRLIPLPVLNAAISVQNIVISSSYLSPWNPIVDGDIIARYGSQQLAEGAFVHVPIIVGATSDEGTVFSPLAVTSLSDFTTNIDDASLPISLPASAVAGALAAYPQSPAYWIPAPDEVPAGYTFPFYLGNATIWRRSAAYFGDAVGIANRRAAAQAWSKAGVPAYSYRFNTIVAGTPAWVGVTHFEDVAFAFDNTVGGGYSTNPFAGMPTPAWPDEAALVSGSWASFIADQDPNGFATRFPAAAPWPQYSLDTPQNLVFEANRSELAFTEPDTFRAEGIQWIQDHALDYRR